MNDKNQMDVDTEKTRKKRERQEIINKFLDKFQGLKEKISEKIEEKKAAVLLFPLASTSFIQVL